MKVEQFLTAVCIGAVLTLIVFMINYYSPLGEYFVGVTLVAMITSNLLMIEFDKIFTDEQ